jgi:two-component system chemotaxis response regulator CheB
VASLPGDLAAAIMVVLHMRPSRLSILDRILARAGSLPVATATDGEPIRNGHIYVAAPDHHLIVERDRVRVLRGPRENAYRPAIDALFRSAAETYGPRVIGVILSGMLDDGTAGLIAIRQCGGIAVVQDPSDADFPDMPSSAIAYAAPDYCLPLEDIGSKLAELATTAPAVKESVMSRNPGHNSGHPTIFTCPDCNGPLSEVKEGKLTRFRCWQQHIYSAESLLEAESNRVERSVWAAARALEELATLESRLADDADRDNKARAARLLRQRSAERSKHAAAVREVLLKGAGET